VSYEVVNRCNLLLLKPSANITLK